jgi:DNA-binding PadR family transcriptional regulator
MRTGTPLELALLGLLGQEPRSGYDLRKVFTATPLSHFSDSPGAIYPALRRLVARKWVSASAPAGGRRRQVFRLTAAGRRAWKGWLRLLPTRDEVVWEMDGLLLRFAFMGETLPAAFPLRFLEAFLGHVEVHVDELRKFGAVHMPQMSATGRLAFEAGIDSYEASASWARRALETLRREEHE